MNTLKNRVEKALSESDALVFISSDFVAFATRAQASRALRALCLEGQLVRISFGMYAKAEISALSGKPYVAAAPMEIALEAMRKLGIEARLGSAYREYNAGLSTQVPAAAILDVGASRITRKIKLGPRELIYERSA